MFVYRENDAGWEKIKSFSHLSSGLIFISVFAKAYSSKLVNSVAWGPQSVDKPLLVKIFKTI